MSATAKRGIGALLWISLGHENAAAGRRLYLRASIPARTEASCQNDLISPSHRPIIPPSSDHFRGGVMLRRRHGIIGSAALLVGLTTLALIDRASAQYYCDERYPASCQTYREPPRLPFPFGLFQPREAPREMVPPPEPAPRPWQQQPAYQVPQQPGYQSPQQPSYQQRPSNVAPPLDPTIARQYAALYAPVNGEPFPIPGIRLSDIDPAYLRKSVYYPNGEEPGTIIVDAQNRFLYLVQGGGRAIRYGVGVGREGL